jgi:hypothetical protein
MYQSAKWIKQRVAYGFSGGGYTAVLNQPSTREQAMDPLNSALTGIYCASVRVASQRSQR